MKKLPYKSLFCVSFFLTLLFPVFGQVENSSAIEGPTAAEIELLLNEPAITYRQAAWFTLITAIDEFATGIEAYVSEHAFVEAWDKGWFDKDAEREAFITMAGLSYLMMNAFDIKGGLMYRLFKTPRNAYRELKNMGYISGDVSANQTVSGEQFFQILGSVANGGSGEI